ncbi:MAG: sensor histidine kinase [Acidobacteria bacterium]|nr:sensor histidine kinase [Acidobacteriota bacterium]
MAESSPTSSAASPATLTLERIKARARLVLAATVGVALLLAPPRSSAAFPLVGFVFAVYVLFSAAALIYPQWLATRVGQAASWAGDAAALLVVLLFAPTHPAPFVLFFVYFTLVAGLWWSWVAAAALSLLVSVGYLLVSWQESEGPLPSWEVWAVGGGLLVAGGFVGAVAERERRYVGRATLTEQYAKLLSLDTRWAELWQRWLDALCRRYASARALLAYHDPETDRVLLWDFRRENGKPVCEESDRPPRDARVFLLDGEPSSILGQGLAARGGARWQLRREYDPAPLDKPFTPPDRFPREFTTGSLMTVPVAVSRAWRGRLFVLDPVSGRFEQGQLDDLQGLVEGLGPVLANLLVVRSLLVQVADREREQISRELHDGVAQTLASLQMQLNVLRRVAAADPTRALESVDRLHKIVQQEQDELRRFLRTLKPVRVPAAELNRWLLAHCIQFQQETGIQVELLADRVDDKLPEGVCREVFLILREALHNVRKHAAAKNVLVRVRLEETNLQLVVDDDGRGFPFAGTYTHRALDEQGLLPVSIGDHTRALGGTVTIDSTPGSGASVRVDIPLS